MNQLSFVIPEPHLVETENLIAFYHPTPGYAIHILLVPKRITSSLMELGEDHQAFIMDLFQAVQQLVAELKLEEAGYRLMANGGRYQEVPYLNFHLVSGEAKQQERKM